MGPRTLSLVALAASLVAATLAAVSGATDVPGNAARGKALFSRPGLFCASCHTLKAAKSTGHDGPNLDRAKPGYARIVDAVTKGHAPTRRWPTGMPAYRGELNKAFTRDLAAFVYGATHR